MQRYDSYKDSGVKWLGEIPIHWEVNKAKYYFISKKEIVGKKSVNYERLALTLKGVVKRQFGDNLGLNPEKLDTYQIVDRDDFIFKLIDLENISTSRIGLSPFQGIVSPAYIRLTAINKKVNPHFIEFYYLNLWMRHIFNDLGSPGVRSNLSASDLLNLPIVCPPLEEQDPMVAYLDSATSKIDEAIAQQQKMIDLLNERKQIIINNAVTKGLDPNVKMKPSGIDWIGDIPEHWEVMKTLFALSMPITDGPHETPQLFDEGIPFVSAEAVSCGNGKIDFGHIRGYISKSFYDECCKKYIPQVNDIYMIKSGATTGKVAIVDTDRIFTIWSPLAVFRCKPSVMYFKYMFYLLQSKPYQIQVQLGWSFGTQQNIGMRTLEKLILPVPPIEEQKELAAIMDEQIDKVQTCIKQAEKQISLLQERKQIIINYVVTGKVKVI